MSGIAGIEYLGEMRRNKYRTCIKLGMKIINSIFTLVGIAMITYSLWMLKKWYGSHQNLTSLHGAPPRPWFIYTFLSMGMILCFVTFIGHIAIETINRNYLAIYIFSLLLLLILQGGAIARVLLDKKWEDDIPDDPTGRFKQLKEFIKNNLSICKCVGLIALVVQNSMWHHQQIEVHNIALAQLPIPQNHQLNLLVDLLGAPTTSGCNSVFGIHS